MAGTHLPQNPSETLDTAQNRWEIQYSRFFNYPSLPCTSPYLRLPNRAKKNRGKGTWLSSSSIASLQLTACPSAQQMVLIVSLEGKIHEEHFVSNLHFSWPQVSCPSECPIRGSRVVFASYRAFEGQVQKFAMRFSASSESKRFINTLKSLKDVIRPPSSAFGPDIASQSEFISSRRTCHRVGKLSSVNSVGDYNPPVQSPLNHECTEYTLSDERLLAHDSEATCATLPPSFTSFLSEPCTVAEQDPAEVHEAVGVKSQIVEDVADSSLFYDMLSKMEMVINELGGDLAL